MAERHKEQIAALATADVRAVVGEQGLTERLPQHLLPSESVAAIALATYADRWWREMRSARKEGMLVAVATDEALVLAPSAGLTGDPLLAAVAIRPVRRLPYEDIDAVESKIGRLESKLTISGGGATIKLSSMRAAGARTLSDAIRRRI